MSNIVIFGATQSGKTTLLGYLSTAMLRNPQFNEEVYQKLKLIKTLTVNDEFNIGNPNNPKKVNKDVILPSFVSLDRDELRKFKDQNTEGTTKRLHRKQLTICMTENFTENGQEETENISCAFVDTPGFRQRLSDQYRGFFEGDVGVAVLKLPEVIELSEMLERKDSIPEKIFALEKRLFEPIRIWCDYRSAAHLVIVLSQVDRVLHSGQTDELFIHALQRGVECVHLYTDGARGGRQIPISPISIKLRMTENKKKIRRMAQFFTRDAENIYTPAAWASYNNVGDGTFISCLKQVLPKAEMSRSRAFSLASADRIMRTTVGHTTKPVVSVLPLYGNIRCTDTVILGPILDRDINEPVYANCKISSIKADGAKETSDLLLEGNVGGIIFKRIQNVETLKQYHIDSVSKNSEIKLLKSTILFSGEALRGDLLELEIRKDEYLTIYGNLDEIYSKILPSIMPFDQVFLFWHGKKISVNIVEISFLESMCKLTVLISNSERNTVNHFAIPCDTDCKIKYHENVLLAVSESIYSNKKGSRQNITEVYTYISATVSGLKESTTFELVKIEGSQYMYLDSIFNGSVHIEDKKTTEGIDSLFIPIKNKKGSISIDSILAMINQSLKKEIDLSEYRKNGGIKLTLL